MNNVLYVNKPAGMTSFDVCYKLRKVLNTKKIGHTGTLDPLARGVMIILYDKATKANQFLVTDYKTYKARVLYGIETDTLDIDGNIINKEEYRNIDKDIIINTLNSFLGKSNQIVPKTSAISINGKRLYEYQRENIDIELPSREIEIRSIELSDIYEDGFSFICEVSSGTYIRSLVRDICLKLNTIGTLKELIRLKVDDISIDDCDNLDDILNGNYKSHNLYELISKRYRCIEYSNIDDIYNGRRIKLDIDDEEIAIVYNNEVLAIYKRDRDEYKSIRGLF